MSNYDNLNSNELLEVYNSQGNFESSSIYTEHDDSHWDRDEYDDYDKEIEVVKEDEYIVDGSARLDDISDLVGVNMESQEFDSIGGLIIGELGRFPENKEEVNIGNIRFVVEEVDKNRIKKVRIYT